MRSKVLLVILPLAMAASACRAEDHFVHRVAPVLARRCLNCHDEATAKGDVSLSDVTNLASYLSPGDPESSYLTDLITPVDGRAEMPKDAEPLSEIEIAAIRNWIEDGAEVPNGFVLQPPVVSDLDWWSLRPIPAIDQTLTPQTVDAHVNRKLNENGMVPLEQADPLILIRRATYDLTGLPPKPRQIDAFSVAWNEDADTAWRALIDRLLNSPEFGEKWAQHWLDIARYAETHGYDKDQPRMVAWPYRDYVIRSFNDDKPVVQFVREQIAGDVLASNKSEGIVATGFLAAGPWDLIGHVEVGEEKFDGRIAKHLDRDEMSSAVFNVFQSTTIQCAQCHHHKFDPIRSEDYYRVQAIFAGVDRAPRVYAGQSDEQLQQSQKLKRQIEDHERRRDQLREERQTILDEHLSELTQELRERDLDSPLAIPSQHGFHSQIETIAGNEKWLQIDLGAPRRLERIELIAAFDRYNDIGEGFGFPVRFKVELSSETSFSKKSTRLVFDSSNKDFPNPGAVPVSLNVSEDPVRLIRITATELAERKNDFIFALGEVRAIECNTGTNVAGGGKVIASDTVPINQRWSPRFAVDGEYYGAEVPFELMVQRGEWLRKRDELITSLPLSADLQKAERRLETLQKELQAIPKGQLVYAIATDFEAKGQFRATEGKARPIYVLNRGDLKSPGDRALPGAPQLWDAAPTQFVENEDYDEAEARAALATYVTREDNPLLWRSMANRIWQWTFGQPIAGTPNDFGRMGMLPTHPELLDLLASSLRDDPHQSIKSMVRTLFLTKTYRRASLAPASDDRQQKNAEVDAGNRFLWRAHRRRLTAEEFRDSVLSISGVLQIENRGGPSFMDFVIEHPQHSPHYEYHQHDPQNPATHRRSIYRFVVRSQPHPMLTTLDCADPSISIAQREESTTALQALTQWNNRLIEVMSRQFADRISKQSGLEKQINFATRLAWGRLPSPSERSILAGLADDCGLETLCRVVLNASALIYRD